ncbi:MAG: hypothetical protein Q9174_001001, partial [Haloplaca sp. 1 TL-2023]
SLVPALQHLFPQSSDPAPNHIKAIASINYRLSPYPNHPTHPSSPDDESRNARWPDHVRDVREGILHVLARKEFVANIGESLAKYEAQPVSNDIILVGHSVGATIAFALALNLDGYDERLEIKAVVGVEGVYDFTAMRDAHLEYRSVYDEICEGAFGPESEGGWEKGNIVRALERGERDFAVPPVVVLGHSKEDELVEPAQSEMMERALRRKGWKRWELGEEGGRDKEIAVVDLHGSHDEIWEQGEQLAKCICLAVEMCARRDGLHRPSS